MKRRDTYFRSQRPELKSVSLQITWENDIL